MEGVSSYFVCSATYSGSDTRVSHLEIGAHTALLSRFTVHDGNCLTELGYLSLTACWDRSMFSPQPNLRLSLSLGATTTRTKIKSKIGSMGVFLGTSCEFRGCLLEYHPRPDQHTSHYSVPYPTIWETKHLGVVGAFAFRGLLQSLQKFVATREVRECCPALVFSWLLKDSKFT